MGIIPLFSGWRNEEQPTKGTERSKIPGNQILQLLLPYFHFIHSYRLPQKIIMTQKTELYILMFECLLTWILKMTVLDLETLN